jgi:hypothetical protein
MKIFLASVLAAAVCAVCAVGCRDMEVVTNTYASMAEAAQVGAIERGWLPRLVPPGAHDIREAHDEAGGRRWGLFSFGPRDSDHIRAAVGAERGFAGVECDAPGRIEWWPVLLRGTLNPEQVGATGLKGYAPAGDSLVVAVNWSQRRAYYWTPR